MSEDNCYNSATPGHENITGIHQMLSSIVSDVIIQHSILTEYNDSQSNNPCYSL